MPTARRRHFRLLPCALAALMALPSVPSRALDVFTGNRPVYLASWYNGSSTEVHEFQFALDWQGWCNAHIGSSCQAIRYWNVAGNWDRNAVPNTFSGDARVEAGHTVRVGGLNSLYLGSIPDSARVSALSAAGRVEVSSQLSVANASFADLYLYSFARLETSGLSTVYNLSSGLGEFSGAGGTTQLQGWQPNTLGRLDLLVKADHRVQLAADAPALPLQVRLEPNARIENLSVLRSAGGSFGLQGTANLATLPTFDNIGTLSGSLSLDGLRFNNSGRVELAADEHIYIGLVGQHSGSFAAGTNSWISFGGFAAVGHNFLAGSNVTSSGQVFAGRGRHVVSGSWNVARTQVDSGGSLSFDGATPSIDELRVTGSLSQATFTPAVQFQDLIIENNGSVRLNGGPSQTQRLQLVSGGLDVNDLLVAQRFDWHSGYLGGTGPLRLPAQTTLHAGGRALATSVKLDGRLDWEGGTFGQWSGAFTISPTGRFYLAGDFDSAGGGGSISNFGRIEKTGGTGRATWGMGVHGGKGSVISVQSGVLALAGGGTHENATFNVSPGAALELSGATVFGGTITKTGKVEVVGGSLELLAGTSYSHGSGARFAPNEVQVGTGASLYLPDPVTLGGNVGNAGTLQTGSSIFMGGTLINNGSFLPGGNVSIYNGFNQHGTFSLPAGASLYVAGDFNNARPLTLTDSPLAVGGMLNNSANLTLFGAIDAHLGQLHNSGTLHLLPNTGANRLWMDGGSNSGTLWVDGSQLDLRVAGGFANSGRIINEGFWRASADGLGLGLTTFINTAGSSFQNTGTLDVDGYFGLLTGSSLTNSGLVRVNFGQFGIDAGATLSGSGRFEQYDGLTFVNGMLQASGGILIDGGVLSGTGQIDGTLILGSSAIWRPGQSPGTQHVKGAVTLNGQLEIEVTSLAVHDRLAVDGSFTAGSGSQINLLLDASFTPVDGDSIDWLQSTGSIGLDYASFNVQGLSNSFAATLDPNSGRIELIDTTAPQIPASGSYTVPLGSGAMNALGDPYNPPGLDLLRVEGRFSNRANSLLNLNRLENLGTLRNRGQIWANEWHNSGQFVSDVGSSFQGNNGHNTGQMELRGASELGSFTNEVGGTLLLAGTVSTTNTVWNHGTLQLTGRWDANWQVLNTGRFVIDAGAELRINTPAGVIGFSHQDSGAELVVNGLLEVPLIQLNGGRLSGAGLLRGHVNANAAEVNPGNSPGTLTIDGDLTATWGTLVLELQSPTVYDHLVVSGNAEIGFIRFVLPADYRPTAGDSFSVLSVGGTLSGLATTGNWHIEAPDPYSSGYYIWGDANGIYDPYHPTTGLRLNFAGGTLSVTAVPEPQTWMLWAGGLLAGAWMRRRAATVTRRGPQPSATRGV